MVTRRRISLLLATSGLAFVLVPGLAACSGDDPGRADIVAKIRSDPRMAGTPDGVVDCLADWYETGASEQARKTFLDGTAPPGDQNSEREAAVLECLKGAT
jgi:hypothetical protein